MRSVDQLQRNNFLRRQKKKKILLPPEEAVVDNIFLILRARKAVNLCNTIQHDVLWLCMYILSTANLPHNIVIFVTFEKAKSNWPRF
jgi:hypothetical protein